jgi:hypothetical protein
MDRVIFQAARALHMLGHLAGRARYKYKIVAHFIPAGCMMPFVPSYYPVYSWIDQLMLLRSFILQSS